MKKRQQQYNQADAGLSQSFQVLNPSGGTTTFFRGADYRLGCGNDNVWRGMWMGKGLDKVREAGLWPSETYRGHVMEGSAPSFDAIYRSGFKYLDADQSKALKASLKEATTEKSKPTPAAQASLVPSNYKPAAVSTPPAAKTLPADEAMSADEVAAHVNALCSQSQTNGRR